MNIFDYLVDPVLRGPTLGSLFQALTTSLIGVIVFLRKETLLGESISHATYPGLILGLFFGALIGSEGSLVLPLVLAAGSAWLGIKTLSFLVHRAEVKSDSALALVLSSFFGFGVLLVSALQHDYGALYKKGEALLMGQIATMEDAHIVFYFALLLVTLLFLILLNKEIKALLFDRSYVEVMGLPVKGITLAFDLFFLIAIVVGIRSTGVVLVASLLVAPPLVAWLLTESFFYFCLLASLTGGCSAFFGTIFSTEATRFFSEASQQRVVFPTGPSIALFLSFFALLAILFSPKKGLIARFIRIYRQRRRRLQENLIKFIWRHQSTGVFQREMQETFLLLFPLLDIALYTLKKEGWAYITPEKRWFLTPEGYKRGSHIVRLHRLWELYLVEVLGKGKEEVHGTAEEMEHILTKEFEQRLSSLLDNPTLDPHNQPIPKI
jgi:manganese/zinc/iron transport system permease protein